MRGMTTHYSIQVYKILAGAFMSNFTLTKPLSRLGRLGRIAMKRFMYSQMAILTGFKIAIGREHPLVRFTVENEPPSIYWVFRIKASEVAGLAKKFSIPPQFSICPIKCLNTDEPAYLLTLNAYRVSGLANGIRAEWSVFVQDSENIPRYMVVDARSSQLSVDPVSIITPKTQVIHEKKGNEIQTQIGEGDNAFRSTITLPQTMSPATTSAEWVSANDTIFWLNGICDRTFYDAGLANASQHRINTENCVIEDGSVWSKLVEPEPVHILIFDNPIEFVISPWENLDRVQTY